ncbi:hypothetical protein [Schlegelella aquatica]|uniref:hypothetical protein n=1 Tax=Caldimonas aquatica TaxID=376175 RepID=UPI0037525CA6
MNKTSIRAAGLAIAVLLVCAGLAQAQSSPAKKKDKATAASQTVVAQASPEQLAAADMVLLGTSQCEFNQSVDVTRSEKHPGYVDLRHGKRTYLMKPLLSSTGAMRLEDVRGEALYIQIANKSMLLNTRTGQRMVDECVHERQRAASGSMRAAALIN